MTDKEIISCQKSQIEDLSVALYERLQRIKVLESEIKQLKEQLDAKCDICIERERTAAIGEFVAAAKDRIVSDFLTTTGGENTAQSLAVLKVLDVLEGLKNEMTEGTDNA